MWLICRRQFRLLTFEPLQRHLRVEIRRMLRAAVLLNNNFRKIALSTSTGKKSPDRWGD